MLHNDAVTKTFKSYPLYNSISFFQAMKDILSMYDMHGIIILQFQQIFRENVAVPPESPVRCALSWIFKDGGQRIRDRPN